MSNTLSNYEKACEDWKVRLLPVKHSELTRKLPELKDKGEYFEITHFGRVYRIIKATFDIEAEDGDPISVDARLNIYTLLWYCKYGASNSGIWVPFRELYLANVFEKAFREHILEPFAETFEGMPEEFMKAGIKMGGLSLNAGDAGIMIDAFSCIPMKIIFWDGDEEFPPKVNILFDKASTDFIHPESIVTIAMEAYRRFVEISGVQVKGSPFSNMNM